LARTSIPVRDQPAGRPAEERTVALTGAYASGHAWRYLSLAPTVILLLALTVLPIIWLAAMSLHTIAWQGGEAQWTFVGLGNYLSMPRNVFFTAALRNTLLFVIVCVAVEMFLGFALALMVSRLVRGRVAFIAIFLLPILVPAIVIGAIFKLMYNYDFGLVNDIVGLVGLPAQDWLGDPNLALASVIVVDIWHWTSFCFLLLLAGLESLPHDLHEAARLDGASFWQELRHVTLPLLMPVLLATLAARALLAFKVFDEVFLLTGGGPGTATEVLSFTVYRVFFTEDRQGPGSAMAMAVIIMVCAMVLIAVLGLPRRMPRP
jgi:multiple sugar transport system permease protein